MKFEKVEINNQWELMLPYFRAKEWRDWEVWEVERLESMKLNIAKGNTLLEIGAEEGDFAALAASWGAKVALIEPSPIMWPNIREIFKQNNLKDPVACFAGFASDKVIEGKTNFDNKIDKGYPKCAYSENLPFREFRHLDREGETTDSITVDEFIKRNNFKPDMVSIDVEGSEWEVLRGMELTLTNIQPMVYVSIHHDLLGKNYSKYFQDILALIAPHGYKMYYLGHDHETHVVFYHKSLKIIQTIV